MPVARRGQRCLLANCQPQGMRRTRAVGPPKRDRNPGLPATLLMHGCAATP